MKVQVIEQINAILAEWDPIGVGMPLATDEYRSYVAGIVRSIKSDNHLYDHLIQILRREMGLPFDSSDPRQVADLKDTCKRLTQAYRLWGSG